MSERPQIGDQVKFRTIGGDLDGTLWQGMVVDIRPAPEQSGTWIPDGAIGYYRFEPAYPPGTRLAYVAVLGWPEMKILDLDRAGFAEKRDGVWRSAVKG